MRVAHGEREDEPIVVFSQASVHALRELVLEENRGGVFRKTSRIIARTVPTAFIVETDRGPMHGRPGDWLVSNHPDDDGGSDIWTISDERMQATYELVED